MTWSDARLALLGVLDDVGPVTVRRYGQTATTTAEIARVYEHPSSKDRDYPSIECVPPAVVPVRSPSGGREQTFTQRIGLRVKDRDPDQAAAIADALRQAIDDRFERSVRLGGEVDSLSGPVWDELAGDDEGELPGVLYVGTLVLTIFETRSDRAM